MDFLFSLQAHPAARGFSRPGTRHPVSLALTSCLQHARGRIVAA